MGGLDHNSPRPSVPSSALRDSANISGMPLLWSACDCEVTAQRVLCSSWLHVIRIKEDDEAERDNWAGRLRATKQAIDACKEQTAKKVEAVERTVQSKVEAVESKVEAVESKLDELKGMIQMLLENSAASRSIEAADVQVAE